MAIIRSGPVDGLDSAASLAGAVMEALGSSPQVLVYGFADFLAAAIAVIEAAGGDADEAKVENFGIRSGDWLVFSETSHLLRCS